MMNLLKCGVVTAGVSVVVDDEAFEVVVVRGSVAVVVVVDGDAGVLSLPLFVDGVGSDVIHTQCRSKTSFFVCCSVWGKEKTVSGKLKIKRGNHGS